MINAIAANLAVFTVVVFVHEFGHYAAARLCGMRIPAFSVGMGPSLAFRINGSDTQWRLGMLPLGGYVKIEEDGSPVSHRAMVAAAGPLASLALAILLFVVCFHVAAGVGMLSGLLLSFSMLWSGLASFAHAVFGQGSVDLVGPVGIASAVASFADQGIVPLLVFTGSLSASLAIFNLLPIPILDGGNLLFCAIEAIRGRPVGEKVEAGADLVAAVLLIGVVGYVTWNDVAGLIAKH